MKFKIIRYYVSPHRSRLGTVTRSGWDVRKVVAGEDGIEREGGFVESFPNKREAKEYVSTLNQLLGKVELRV